MKKYTFICVFPNKLGKIHENTLETPIVRITKITNFQVSSGKSRENLAKRKTPGKTGALDLTGA